MSTLINLIPTGTPWGPTNLTEYAYGCARKASLSREDAQDQEQREKDFTWFMMGTPEQEKPVGAIVGTLFHAMAAEWMCGNNPQPPYDFSIDVHQESKEKAIRVFEHFRGIFGTHRAWGAPVAIEQDLDISPFLEVEGAGGQVDLVCQVGEHTLRSFPVEVQGRPSDGLWVMDYKVLSADSSSLQKDYKNSLATAQYPILWNASNPEHIVKGICYIFIIATSRNIKYRFHFEPLSLRHKLLFDSTLEIVRRKLADPFWGDTPSIKSCYSWGRECRYLKDLRCDQIIKELPSG